MAVDADGNGLPDVLRRRGRREARGPGWTRMGRDRRGRHRSISAMRPEGTGDFAPTTGVAVDEHGVRYVTYTDQRLREPRLVRRWRRPTRRSTRQPGQRRRSRRSPSRPTVPAILRTWYDDEGQACELGIHADLQDLQIANPSPTPEVDRRSRTGRGVATTVRSLLDIVGPGGHRLRHELPRRAGG